MLHSVTHIVLEAICTLLGLAIYVRSVSSKNLDIKYFGQFGLFLFLTGILHIGVSTLYEFKYDLQATVGIPVSWLFPAIVVPIWFLYISRPKQMKVPFLALSVVGLIVFLGMLYTINPISKTLIARPLEAIPILIGCIVIKKVFNNNGKGRVKTLALSLFILSHLTSMFSSHLYDDLFVISHTLKLSWHLVLLLLMYNLYYPQYTEKDLINMINETNE